MIRDFVKVASRKGFRWSPNRRLFAMKYLDRKELLGLGFTEDEIMRDIAWRPDGNQTGVLDVMLWRMLGQGKPKETKRLYLSLLKTEDRSPTENGGTL